ncbi:hypothetical protein BC938DRAFT_484311 [Jimgerdemannia flammicorona]|uniref:F-box domain-containing protein n=1 Tax=Jimgerdemannia flammicorona TaxID=994334 RepID=A0A433QA06_9FUNG|nr:hypothetical protein BC938DRAFT_484311 [Jimgerdemannia flammicorona]
MLLLEHFAKLVVKSVIKIGDLREYDGCHSIPPFLAGGLAEDFGFPAPSPAMAITALPNEVLQRVLMHVGGSRFLHRLRSLCRLLAQTIKDDNFRAVWLLAQYGSRALATGIAIQLRPAYPWPLTETAAMFLASHGSDPYALRGLPLVWTASVGFKAVFMRLLDGCSQPPPVYPHHPWPNVVLRQYVFQFFLSRFCPKPPVSPSPSQTPLDLALQAACGAGHADLVEAILQRFPADVNATNDLALRLGVTTGNVEIVRLLLGGGTGAGLDLEELLSICLGSPYRIEDAEMRENRRVLFHMLLETQAVDGVEAIIRNLAPGRSRSTLWWPAIEHICKHHGEYGTADLAMKMLLDGRTSEARSLFLKVEEPRPVPTARAMQIVEWVLDRATPFHHDLAFAFAVNSELSDPASLVRFLLVSDSVFQLPWVIQLARSEYHQSKEAMRVLDEHGLTRVLSDAVFQNSTSLLAAWTEYTVVAGLDASTAPGLSHSLRNRIMLKDLPAAVLLTEIGARGEVGIETYLDQEWGDALGWLDFVHRCQDHSISYENEWDRVPPIVREIDETARPDPRTIAVLLASREYQLRVVQILAQLPPVVLVRLFHEGAIDFGEWGRQITAAAADAGHWRVVRAVLWVPEFREQFRSLEDGRLRIVSVVQEYELGRKATGDQMRQVLEKYKFEWV